MSLFLAFQWKGSLAQLADLDFYIKECIESAEDDDNNSGNKYLKYDIFAADLKGLAFSYFMLVVFFLYLLKNACFVSAFGFITTVTEYDH